MTHSDSTHHLDEKSASYHKKEAHTDTASSRRKRLFEIYSPLVYSIFYFIAPIQHNPSALTIAVILGVFIIQCALYLFMALTTDNRLRAFSLIVSICITFLSTQINSSAYPFYWFCLFIAALYFPLKFSGLILAAIIAFVLISARLFDLEYIWFYLPSILPGFGLFSYGMQERSKRAQLVLEKKSKEEISALATIAERERIARDLHDIMGHNLVSLALKAQLAGKQSEAGRTKLAIKEIHDIEHISREMLAEMRSVINGYKSRSLSEQIDKLSSTLRDAQFLVEKNITVPTLTALEESTLVLAITESITNILKHSRGDKVRMYSEYTTENNSWRLHIEDNGVCESLHEGHGIKGMRERLDAIGATLELTSLDGVKLSIRLHLKIAAQS